MQARLFSASFLSIAIAMAGARSHAEGNSECSAYLPDFVPSATVVSQNTQGDATSSAVCNFAYSPGAEIAPFTGPYGALVDVAASYASVVQDEPYYGPPGTPEPLHRASVQLDVDDYPLAPFFNPNDIPEAIGESSFTQAASGTTTGGGLTAMAHVEYDVDMTITLTAEETSDDRADFVAYVSFTLAPPSGLTQQTFLYVDSSGDVEAPTGIDVVEIQPDTGVFVVSGAFSSDSFPAPTDGTSFAFTSTLSFEASVVQQQQLGDPISGTIDIDAADTIVARLLSDDPNATFSLPIPSPEPTSTALGAVAFATLAATRQRHKR
jgi:hypothetical protein